MPDIALPDDVLSALQRMQDLPNWKSANAALYVWANYTDSG
jgi:hypothetical protein